MKIFILNILLILATLTCYSQRSKQVDIPKNINGDTDYSFKYKQSKAVRLKLEDLITSTESFHFRFWTNNQAIDILSNDFKYFSGFITSFIERDGTYDKVTQKNTPTTLYSRQEVIDTAIARHCFQMIQRIQQIPTEDSIKGWRHGFDGYSYNFELSTIAQYSFKSYWSPSYQDSNLAEATQIQKFSDSLNRLLKLDSVYQRFFDPLPPGTYTNGSMWAITKFSDTQKEAWKKYRPFKQYLDSVAPTLNKYLCDTLTSLLLNNGKLSCGGQYSLRFSKKNKLQKIIIEHVFTEYDDKRDFYRCRRKIRKAFRKIHIDFVHSKVDYIKTIEFISNKVRITNSMVF